MCLHFSHGGFCLFNLLFSAYLNNAVQVHTLDYVSPLKCYMLTFKSMLIDVLYSVFYFETNYLNLENDLQTLRQKSTSILILLFKVSGKTCFLKFPCKRGSVNYTNKIQYTALAPSLFCIQLFNFSFTLCLFGNVSWASGLLT